jgi:hypothetical protein
MDSFSVVLEVRQINGLYSFVVVWNVKQIEGLDLFSVVWEFLAHPAP